MVLYCFVYIPIASLLSAKCRIRFKYKKNKVRKEEREGGAVLLPKHSLESVLPI